MGTDSVIAMYDGMFSSLKGKLFEASSIICLVYSHFGPLLQDKSKSLYKRRRRHLLLKGEELSLPTLLLHSPSIYGATLFVCLLTSPFRFGSPGSIGLCKLPVFHPDIQYMKCLDKNRYQLFDAGRDTGGLRTFPRKRTSQFEKVPYPRTNRSSAKRTHKTRPRYSCDCGNITYAGCTRTYAVGSCQQCLSFFFPSHLESIIIISWREREEERLSFPSEKKQKRY